MLCKVQCVLTIVFGHARSVWIADKSFVFKSDVSEFPVRYLHFNALTAVGALMTLIDFTLSNTRGFYSSMGNPLAIKVLR